MTESVVEETEDAPAKPNDRDLTISGDHIASVIKADGYAWEVRDKVTNAVLARGWSINRWVSRIAAHASASGLEKHPDRE
jgi:hypothetical protein